jgi:TatD DNase family protein
VRLFDAHCHLHDPRLDPWRADALAEARALGLRGFACCAAEEDEWPAVLALADAEPDVVPSLGLHPWLVAQARPGWQARLAQALRAAPWAGVGEAGLDRARRGRGVASAEEQEAALVDQARLAVELRRPLALHGVRAWSRVLELLRPLGHHAPGWLLHSFAGPAELVEPLAELGAWFSFSGIVTRHKATRTHAAARAVPPERLLAETDAPDILPILGAEALADPALPRDEQGRVVNLPRNLSLVVEALAELRGEPPEALARRCHDNAQRLFAPLRAAREPYL